MCGGHVARAQSMEYHMAKRIFTAGRLPSGARVTNIHTENFRPWQCARIERRNGKLFLVRDGKAVAIPATVKLTPTSSRMLKGVK
jgi:hypothetical protein